MRDLNAEVRALREKEATAHGGITPEPSKREFFIDNLLVRIHCIVVMIR